MGVKEEGGQSLKDLRKAFVREQYPEFVEMNEEFKLGFNQYGMLRILWIKSRRLKRLVRKNQQE